MAKLIVGNWKMNKTASEAAKLIGELKQSIKEGANVVVCPPFTALQAAADALKGTGIALGSQNMHSEASGAFTGEVSAAMIKDLGVKYVILGHSERRAMGEDNKLINSKVLKALFSGLIPIVCIGESLAQREEDSTEAVLEEQIEKCLASVSEKQAKNVVVAYEPLWAIGTGKAASPKQVQEVHGFIRNVLKAEIGLKAAPNVRILYGGSVKPENASELLKLHDVDGCLVGGASLDAKSFAAIANQ